jgi:YYY domain-containing protein
MGQMILWWLLIELLGVAGLPLAAVVFANLPDRGWALAKPLSLLIVGWLVWFPLSLVSALPFSGGWIASTVLGFALVNWRLLEAPGVRQGLRALWMRSRGYVLGVEALFAVAFVGMAWERSFTPGAVDTEKFMDLAFLSAIWRAPHLPPPDPWLSGQPINYYYFGHYLLALVAKVLGTQPAVAFNTGIALIFALTAVAVFGVAANLFVAARPRLGFPGSPLQRAWIPGLASVVLVLVLGNLAGARSWWTGALALTNSQHSILANPWLWWLDRGLWTQFDWWAPSRVILNTINEFPAFSFVLADLHAHVLALPFATLAVALALNLLLADDVGLRVFGGGTGWITLVASAVALGALYAINGWDLPTYLGLALLALALQQWLAHDRQLDSRTLRDFALAGGALALLAVVTFLPFYHGFVSPSQGLGLVSASARSSLSDEFAIFGLPAFLLLSFLLLRLTQWLGALGVVTAAAGLLLLTRATGGFTGWTTLWGIAIVATCGVLALRKLGALPDWITRQPGAAVESRVTTDAEVASVPHWRDRAEVFLYCLAGTAAALVVGCELIYLRDVFAGTSAFRMNTVFKLYFQAWLLAGLAAGPVAVWLVSWAAREIASLFVSAGTRPRVTEALAVEPMGASAVTVGTLATSSTSPGGGSLSQPLPFHQRRGADSEPLADVAQGGRVEPSGEEETDVRDGAGVAGVDGITPLAHGTSRETQPAQVGDGRRAVRSTEAVREHRAAATARSAARKPLGAVFSRQSRGSTPISVRPWPEADSALRWLRAGGILVWMGMLTVLLTAALVYPVLATSARTSNFTLPRTLDGAAYMATDALNAGDKPAIEWLNAHVSGDPVIVEAAKYDEYTHLGRVSAFTGLPTLLGWGGHEVQWRLNWLAEPGHANVIGERLIAVNAIYTDADPQAVLRVMREYSVQLVYVGGAERAQYPGVDLTRFGHFLRVVYARDGVTIYAAPSFQERS